MYDLMEFFDKLFKIKIENFLNCSVTRREIYLKLQFFVKQQTFFEVE